MWRTTEWNQVTCTQYTRENTCQIFQFPHSTNSLLGQRFAEQNVQSTPSLCISMKYLIKIERSGTHSTKPTCTIAICFYIHAWGVLLQFIVNSFSVLKRRSTGNPWLVMAATCVVFISQAAASATRDKLHRQHHLVFRYTLYFQRRETTKWLSYNHMSALFANKSGCTAHNEATKVFSLYLVTRLSVSVRFHYTVMS